MEYSRFCKFVENVNMLFVDYFCYAPKTSCKIMILSKKLYAAKIKLNRKTTKTYLYVESACVW